MQIIALDFETYYDKNYTLKKLTVEEYVRDKRFEVLGCGVRYPDGGLQWLTGDSYIQAVFRENEDCAFLCHHAHFDGLILSHRYGIKPARWLDTLSMARQVVGNHLPKGLEALAKHYGLAGKTVPYDLFKGKHWDELDPETQAAVRDGCLHDVQLTWELFNLLAREFPKSEYALVDLTVRMFTEPMLEGDLALFGKLWLEERDRKGGMLQALGVTAKQLGSSAEFADLLRARGIEPPKKPGKNGEIYAFAKTDQFMRDRQEDQDEYVCNLVRARLGIRSTIIQSRVERLGNMASRGTLPVYIAYCGAHTTRWSGADKTNWQNFKRGHAIRDAIRAPKGFICAVADASQIECIAEGELVLTRDRGLVPIQNVVVDDYVWDGLEWVTHQGVIYKGVRDVISYQGLRATPEHIIYLPDGQSRSLLSCAGTRSGIRAPLPPTDLLETTLHLADVPRLQDLWRARSEVQFPQRESGGAVGAGEPAASDLQGHGDRPDQQQRTLRTGELAAFDAARERQQSLYDILGADGRWHPVSYGELLQGVSGLQSRYGQGSGGTGTDGRRDHRPVQAGSLGRAKAPVYDLLNAGPRHRFTVSGVLVSNCRILSAFAGAADDLRAFREGRDLYSEMATRLYGRPVTRNDPVERGTGKQIILSCGYGSGGETFQRTARLGIYGPPIEMTLEWAKEAVGLYRATHPMITSLWGSAGRLLPILASPGHPPVYWAFGVWLAKGRLYGPSGAWIDYSTLRSDGQGGWKFQKRDGWRSIWGGFLVENLVQFLARIHLGEVMKQLVREGIPKIALCTHDDIFALVRDDDDAEKWLGHMIGLLSKPPAWMPDVPLAAEGHLGRTYGEAK